jgi:hypothetical protein
VQVSALFIMCAGIFWALACASLALNGSFDKPLRHLLTGAVFHIFGFIFVATIWLARRRKLTKNPGSEDTFDLNSPSQVQEW